MAIKTIIKVQHRRTRMFLALDKGGRQKWVRYEGEAREFPTEREAVNCIPGATKRDNVWLLPRAAAQEEA